MPPEGGDTLFAGTAAAYEALPTDLKERISGLKGVHVLNKVAAAQARDGQLAKLRPAVHPLVRTHPQRVPETGLKIGARFQATEKQ